MKRRLILIAVIIALSPLLFSFCGFYVSKADGTIKNKTSQVILVRDGNRNVVTMYNDFKGETKDFAMVVPVPTVLKKADIRVVDQSIFQRLNDYSSPRLVEYYDQNPCNKYDSEDVTSLMTVKSFERAAAPGVSIKRKGNGVKVEAKYLVGEYDILILSAKKSGGLKEWLTGNGYKIPGNAQEVLDPYIKSNLKFFVVKVNEQEKKKLAGNFLRPLQISFNSPKFMLPIRLGMANADGDQDLVVYAFTRTGRIECTNYRNVDIATGEKVPLFIKQNFGSFYGSLFTHQWEKERRNIAFLEYAWDVSPANYVKCDPCVGNPPTQQDIVQSGVWWLQKNWEDYTDVNEDDVNYNNNKVYFTRLHFRYNRRSFPQDLSFQVTPNTSNFQARYIITHPATGDLNCDAGKIYLRGLKKRRKDELKALNSLTGRNINNWQDDIANHHDPEDITAVPYARLLPEYKHQMEKENRSPGGLILFGAVVLGSAGFLRWKGFV
ncbi:MAG: DUF2330 domain-containing protein [Ferruginibacter sp.]